MSIFWKRSVASITSALSGIVSDLEAHYTTKTAEAAKHRDAANLYAGKANEADTEAGKALSISAKITGLLS